MHHLQYVVWEQCGSHSLISMHLRDLCCW